MDTQKRLAYIPGEGWILESITESGQIMDFAGLTAGGVAMRFNKEEVLGSLRAAISELEVA